MLALATMAVVVLRTFFFDPTLWSLTAGTNGSRPLRGRIARSDSGADRNAHHRTTVAHIHSKLPDKVIAVLTMMLLVSFLGIVAWNVRRDPLIAVFVIAMVAGEHVFIRELRSQRDATNT
ncbi:MAG: hypothetical protein U5R46_04360 [Gammaproteobacteria bacterium]|nr:hypothetical protein [Gammaproteobacteria bacterium]